MNKPIRMVELQGKQWPKPPHRKMKVSLIFFAWLVLFLLGAFVMGLVSND